MTFWLAEFWFPLMASCEESCFAGAHLRMLLSVLVQSQHCHLFSKRFLENWKVIIKVNHKSLKVTRKHSYSFLAVLFKILAGDIFSFPLIKSSEAEWNLPNLRRHCCPDIHMDEWSLDRIWIWYKQSFVLCFLRFN